MKLTKIVLFIVVLLVNTMYGNAQIIKSVLVYVVEKGVSSSVKISTENELRMLSRNAVIRLYEGNSKNFKQDGIYLDYTYLGILGVGNIKTHNLDWNDLQTKRYAELRKKFENCQQFILRLYEGLNTETKKHFFIDDVIIIEHGLGLNGVPIYLYDKEKLKNQIKKIQLFLTTMGFYTCAKCTVDGVVGSNTLKAYESFVATYKLNLDLISVDHETGWTIPKIKFSNPDAYVNYVNRQALECESINVCVSKYQINLTLECSNMPPLTASFDLMSANSILVGVKGNGIEKVVPLRSPQKATSVSVNLDCEINASYCMGTKPEASLSLCGVTYSRGEKQSINFSVEFEFNNGNRYSVSF